MLLIVIPSRFVYACLFIYAVNLFDFRILAKNGKVEDRLRYSSLSDLLPGTVLEVHSYKKIETVVGVAFVIKTTETVTNDKQEHERIERSIIIGSRFEDDLKMVPCCGYFKGTKQLKGGKTCHEFRLIKINDKDVFRDGDVYDEDMSLTPTKPYREIFTDPNKSDSTPCQQCVLRDDFCTGFCQACGSHQPPDGTQCDCS